MYHVPYPDWSFNPRSEGILSFWNEMLITVKKGTEKLPGLPKIE
jgi:hypothetical protein